VHCFQIATKIGVSTELTFPNPYSALYVDITGGNERFMLKIGERIAKYLLSA